jgi:hypothetical protein
LADGNIMGNAVNGDLKISMAQVEDRVNIGLIK